jgi:hypothetical protein
LNFKKQTTSYGSKKMKNTMALMKKKCLPTLKNDPSYTTGLFNFTFIEDVQDEGGPKYASHTID